MAPEEMKARAGRIRLTAKALARAAGLNHETVGRTLSGNSDPRYRTAHKIAAEIEAEELRLLLHLRTLHNDEHEVQALGHNLEGAGA